MLYNRITTFDEAFSIAACFLDVEENECFDINLLVNGTKPERLVTSLVCHIEHHPEPITLAVEVTFKVGRR